MSKMLQCGMVLLSVSLGASLTACAKPPGVGFSSGAKIDMGVPGAGDFGKGERGYRIRLPARGPYSDWPTSLAWSPDGRSVAVGTRLGYVGIYDPVTRARQRELQSPGHTTRLNLDFYTTPPRYRRGELIPANGCRGGVCAVAFSPNSQLLAVGSDDGRVRLWDTSTWVNSATLAGHTGIIRSVAFSPDGSMLASTGDDRSTRLWDIATGKLRRHVDWGIHPPNWWKLLPIVTHSVQFSPDGKLMAVGGSGGVQFRDVESGELLAQIDENSFDDIKKTRTPGRADVLIGSVIAFSPDGRQLAFRYAQRKTGLWNISTKSIAAVLQISDDPNERHISAAYAFSPDGKLLAVGGYYKSLHLWRVDQGKFTELLPYHRGMVTVDNVQFSPDGKTLVSSEWSQRDPNEKSDPAKIRFWNVTDGIEIFPHAAPQDSQ